MRPGLAATALLAALVTGCGDHAHNPGTIVFQSDRNGHNALYAVHPDGTGLVRLPFRRNADVAWARDGSKALVSYTTGTGDDVSSLFNPTRGTLHRLRLPGVLSIGGWSPDGTRLAFLTSEGSGVLEVKTGQRVRLDAPGAQDPPTWSSDGKRLLFVSGADFYSVPADGDPASLLMNLGRIHPHIPAFADQPGGAEWSADGKWISFFDDGLYVVRSDGTGRRVLDHNADDAAWSPAGERLAFPTRRGIVLVDLEAGHRRQVTSGHLGDSETIGPVWSPDGERLLYLRNDLGFGSSPGYHDQLWTVKADGTDNRPLTRAFPDDGDIANASPGWVETTLKGALPPKLPVVALSRAGTLSTKLPIIGLGAEGNRAAAAQGFTGYDAGPTGPIVVWDPVRNHSTSFRVRGCGRALDVVVVPEIVGYRCHNASEGYTVHDSLRIGATEVSRTHGEEFTGSFLGGIAADRHAIAFDIASAGNTREGQFRIRRTTVWRVTGSRRSVVRTFQGEANVESFDAGRIAVSRGGRAISVLSPGGRVRTFSFGRAPILGAALAGPRLLALQARRLTALDLASGKRTTWPVLRGFGPKPYLQDAQGNLAAYVVGIAIHVIRLSDGREIVVQTPNATEPVFARFVPSGLFYSFNEAYDKRPGRLVFVARSELDRALASRAAAP